MKVYSLSSGSKGNATLIVCDNFNILIDAGTTKKYLMTSLEEVGYSINDIDMLLVTHFHSDHVKSLNCFSPEIIYSCRNEHKTLELNQDNDFVNIIIRPFELSHDDRCFGYQIKFNGTIYTHISDTGYLKNDYLPLIAESDYLYLEFNHDLELLKKTNRPAFTKQRIISDLGHLNNQDAALALCKCSNNIKQLFVAHISEQANTNDKIAEAIKEVFSDFQKEINFEIKYTAHHTVVMGGNGNHED